MTLLELLVKYLPGRGGWPEGAFECFIHEKVQDRGFFYSADGGGVYGSSSIDTNSVEYVQNCSYIPGYNVTREQYEAAIAAQQPVWDGEGLPPVGAECEITAHNNRWGLIGGLAYKGSVISYNGEEFWFKDVDGTNTITRTDKVDFRPIRTEAERKRDIAVGAMEKSWEAATDKPAHDFESIYGAIAAGKIPGVELSK